MIAQSQSEDNEGIRPHVLEGKSPQIVNAEVTRHQHPDGLNPRQPVERGSYEETETLNVLVNDRSSVGTYALDLIAPPKLISKITQMRTLEPKRFSRDLRSGKVKRSVYSSRRTST